MAKMAIILVRGTNKLNYNIRSVLKHMNLFHVNNCVILNDTPSSLGAIKKVKDFITYGKVNEETIKLLSKQRALKEKTYVLHPPRKGWERKGIKTAYTIGGALGLRDNMDDLIKKMLT